jgi:hypothetical protein
MLFSSGPAAISGSHAFPPLPPIIHITLGSWACLLHGAFQLLMWWRGQWVGLINESFLSPLRCLK